jgi:hypothetical protein
MTPDRFFLAPLCGQRDALTAMTDDKLQMTKQPRAKLVVRRLSCCHVSFVIARVARFDRERFFPFRRDIVPQQPKRGAIPGFEHGAPTPVGAGGALRRSRGMKRCRSPGSHRSRPSVCRAYARNRSHRRDRGSFAAARRCLVLRVAPNEQDPFLRLTFI